MGRILIIIFLEISNRYIDQNLEDAVVEISNICRNLEHFNRNLEHLGQNLEHFGRNLTFRSKSQTFR